MMAFLEMQESVDIAEVSAYVEHEVSCPFCEEGNWLSVSVTVDGTNYICGKCGKEWLVIRE